MDLFPGTKLGIGPAIDDGFYYDFDLPRPLTPDDLASIEARMAESVAADHPFVRHELDPVAGRTYFVEHGQPYKVEILDDLAARAEAEGQPLPPVSTYEHGPFSDLCKGPHVASTGRIGPFKLLSVAGAYWRGERDAPDAPAHLRHGLVDPGRARPVSLAAGGGQEARPSAARPRARPVQLPSGVACGPVLAPARDGPLAGARDVVARGPPVRRVRRGAHAGGRPPGAVADLRSLGALPGQHVRPGGWRPRVGAQADELPRVDAHLQDPGALVPRPADAAGRLQLALPQRADRRARRGCSGCAS